MCHRTGLHKQIYEAYKKKKTVFDYEALEQLDLTLNQESKVIPQIKQCLLYVFFN